MKRFKNIKIKSLALKTFVAIFLTFAIFMLVAIVLVQANIKHYEPVVFKGDRYLVKSVFFDRDERVGSVYLPIDKKHTNSPDSLTIKYYIHDVWASNYFSAETIAKMIMDSGHVVLSNFKTQNSSINTDDYYVVYMNKESAEIFFSKIVDYKGGAFSVTYRTAVTDENWIKNNVLIIGEELDNFLPRDEWLDEIVRLI